MNEQLKQKMQLLFRNNLENYLAESGNDLFCDYVRGLKVGYMVGATALYHELRDQIEWVDVNERLPEFEKPFLLKYEAGYYDVFVRRKSQYNHENESRYREHLRILKVTHWRKI